MDAAGPERLSDHPSHVAIPDPAVTEGLRSYHEPEQPDPLQLVFLEEEGERAYVERIRGLLVAGSFAEAADRLMADLAGFGGALAQKCRALGPDAVSLDGWEDLLPILAEFEGPPITAITVGLTNDADLEFGPALSHEPVVLLNLYSDEVFDFTGADRDRLLADCGADYPGWLGHEEDVEFYVECNGLAELNTALVTHKHRHFLRDGRDGVSGRAPGGYVEYVLGCWLRTTRFLQAVERAAANGGVPDGVVLIVGTVGLHADVATIVDAGRRIVLQRASSAPAPLAALTVKPWVSSAVTETEQPELAAGASFRRRLAQVAPEAPEVAAATVPVGLFTRLLRWLKGRR